MPKKVQICYGVDVDCVSGWIGSYGGEDSISDISRGLQAGEQNVRRLLKLFKKYNLTQTFYIPGHSLETFPKECKAIRDVSTLRALWRSLREIFEGDLLTLGN
jgi:hypothetical protein